jgi:molybdate transport system ATP-binding protein
VAYADVRLEVALDLPCDGVTALFGPSGSGKTTCLRVLAGLERARGCVSVAGECWQDDARGIFVPTHRRAVGYVFQDASLFPHLSVRKNLDYGRKRSGARASPADVRAIVDLVGLGDLLERSPRHLSGGERQRVAIARALVASPRLLLMDEPLASLDAARKAEILPYLERLRDELSIPIVYVSHALEEVARLAGHLVLLDGGRVVASGPTAETFARLDLPLARSDDGGALIEARVAVHDEVDQLTRLDFDGGSLWVTRVARPSGARARVRVLARDVSLARDPPGLSSILNVLAASVAELRDHGPDRVDVRLSIGGGPVSLLARITRRSRDALGLHVGLGVHALVKSVALVV